ncbi:MAG: C_GCAxxG_C_C family protein [Clostridiales bacterium]|nr:C_GCAxxG_C_C family protein [Clostridiales bacterium]
MTIFKDYDYYGEKAENYFLLGYNCAQSLILTFADDFGLDPKLAERLAFPFGAGMGRLREVCGALSASFMLLGLRSAPKSDLECEAYDDEKAAAYAEIQAFAKKFEFEFGSIYCRDLLGLEGKSDPKPEKRTLDYYNNRPCNGIIKITAYMLAEYLAEKEN